MNPKFSRIKLSVFGFLVTLFILLMLEAGSRVVLTLREDVRSAESDWFTYSKDLGWTRRPGFRGVVGGFEREFDSQGYFSTDSAKISNADKKVIMIGDSNTFGFGTPSTESFAEVVDKSLDGVSVINLGVVGASSYQGRMALARYLPVLKPDLVVASYNFNDRRYVLDRSQVDSAEEFNRITRSSTGFRGALSLVLNDSYLSRLMRSLLVHARLIPEHSNLVDVSKAAPRVDEENYRANLEDMIQVTRRSGIPIIFILLKDNPLQTESLNAGIESLSKGDFSDGISTLRAAVDANNTFSDLARIYLARAYEATGRKQEASGVLMSQPYVSLTGGNPVRLDRDYNRIMKEVAASYGVPVVDGGSVLDEHPSVYVDFCHFNAAGHRRLGELVAGEVARLIAHRQEPQLEQRVNERGHN